jgi:hypothetical protein
MKKKPVNAMITLSLVYQAIRDHNLEIGNQLDNEEISADEYRRATFPPLAIPTIQKKVDDYFKDRVNVGK